MILVGWTNACPFPNSSLDASRITLGCCVVKCAICCRTACELHSTHSTRRSIRANGHYCRAKQSAVNASDRASAVYHLSRSAPVSSALYKRRVARTPPHSIPPSTGTFAPFAISRRAIDRRGRSFAAWRGEEGMIFLVEVFISFDERLASLGESISSFRARVDDTRSIDRAFNEVKRGNFSTQFRVPNRDSGCDLRWRAYSHRDSPDVET